MTPTWPPNRPETGQPPLRGSNNELQKDAAGKQLSRSPETAPRSAAVEELVAATVATALELHRRPLPRPAPGGKTRGSGAPQLPFTFTRAEAKNE